MESEDNFYIHLNSNVNDLIIDDCEQSEALCKNKIGNFVNRLNRRIQLKGSWEVAMTNIQYRKSWKTVPEDQELGIYCEGEEMKLDEKFPKGNYSNPRAIIVKLNEIFSTVNEPTIEFMPQFHYDAGLTNRVKIKLGRKKLNNGNKIIFPKLSEYLAGFLGVVHTQSEFEKITKKLADFEKDNYKIENDKNLSNSTKNNDTPSQLTESKPSEETEMKKETDQNKSETIVTTTSTATTTTTSTNTTTNIDESLKKVKLSPNIAITYSPSDPVFNTFDIPKTETSSKKPEPSRKRLRKKDPPLPKYFTPPEDDTFDPTKVIPAQYNDSPVLISAAKNEIYLNALNDVTIHGPTDTLYIYCNLIQPTLIGNFEAQLIRRVAVPFKEPFGNLCEDLCLSKEYYPLLYNEFDRIEIDIHDDSGKTINFEFGKVALTLHFRKVNNYGV